MAGLWLTWLVLKPLFGVRHSFGMLLETGFAGGHGTAAAMGLVLQSPAVGMDNGGDLGIMMATVGLIASVTTGIMYINVAARQGWVKTRERLADSAVAGDGRGGKEPPAAGALATNDSVQADSAKRAWTIGTWGRQLLLLGVACLLGALLQRAIHAAALALDFAERASSEGSLTLAKAVESFPLFIYSLFGGLLVRLGLTSCGSADWIHASTLQRIVGVAMEFLVVAAIATMNVWVIAAAAAPLTLLILLGLLWTAFCLFFVSRWLLPKDCWFELGLLNYGMSTGTTATGFVLLRVVDPRLESGAAEDYALAAPLSAPFVGGGVITMTLPLIWLERTESLAAPCLSLTAALMLAAAAAWRLGRGEG